MRTSRFYFPAAAAATLLLADRRRGDRARGGSREIAVARLGRRWLARGGRSGAGDARVARSRTRLRWCSLAASVLALAGMALWSFADAMALSRRRCRMRGRSPTGRGSIGGIAAPCVDDAGARRARDAASRWRWRSPASRTKPRTRHRAGARALWLLYAAAAGAAGRVPVRRAGAAGPRSASTARSLAVALGAPGLRAALRVPVARRSVARARSALRAHARRASARRRARVFCARQAADAAAAAADRVRGRLRGQRRPVPADAVRRQRPRRRR